jgi:hypothetical protein
MPMKMRMGSYSTLMRRARIKRQKVTSVGKDVQAVVQCWWDFFEIERRSEDCFCCKGKARSWTSLGINNS